MKIAPISIAAALALTACGGATMAPQLNVHSTSWSATSAAVRAGTPRPDRRRSWVAPEVEQARSQLLFVSDAGTDDVYMYDASSLKLVGTITGFSQPQGECAGSHGDVWITDTSAQKIYEVSHAGRLVSSLADGEAYPDGCAWNPKNGDVAVMNLFGKSGARGSVLVYPNGSMKPTSYSNPHQYYYNFGGYDDSGDLFFDGRSATGTFMLSELAAGSTSAKTIEVTRGRIYFPGLVQWDGSNGDLLVGDQKCGGAYAACVYRLTLTGYSGKIVGVTKLQNAQGGRVCDLVQGVVANGQIFGSDNEFCGYSAPTTAIWPYPGGGQPAKSENRTGAVPVGAALSGGGGAPAASNEDLVYVSNADGEVTVYDYASQSLVGVLADFTTPTGECVDKSGKIFIADSGRKKIYEYAHGATKATKILDDSPYVPNACSVDRLSGNLAVANSGGNGGTGNIAIYARAAGKPKLLDDKNISDFQACAYDNLGNLLVTGTEGSSSPSIFAWLPKKLVKLVGISVPGPNPSWTWNDVTGIQWDGKFFALDRDDAYQVALINGQAYYVSETALGASYLRGKQYGIYESNSKRQGTQILVGYNNEGYSSGVYYFRYPAGGAPRTGFSHGVDDPYAVVVSLAPHR